MSQVYVSMAMSLDGFITGPHDDAQNPAGINGMRLMDWLGGGGRSDASGVEAYRPRDPNSQIVFDEGLATGAVITGKRTGDFAGYWGGDHHNGVPIFVPTHRAPAENPFEQVHYVTDGIAACVEQAKAAAGDRDVFMHGAYTAQQALKAGVLDAVEIQLRPVLLGQGRRLFDDLPPEHIELDLVRARPRPCTCATRSDTHDAARLAWGSRCGPGCRPCSREWGGRLAVGVGHCPMLESAASRGPNGPSCGGAP
jgi:dihydrofolate reductase